MGTILHYFVLQGADEKSSFRSQLLQAFISNKTRALDTSVLNQKLMIQEIRNVM